MILTATKLTKRKQEELRLIANSTYEGILTVAAESKGTTRKAKRRVR